MSTLLPIPPSPASKTSSDPARGGLPHPRVPVAGVRAPAPTSSSFAAPPDGTPSPGAANLFTPACAQPFVQTTIRFPQGFGGCSGHVFIRNAKKPRTKRNISGVRAVYAGSMRTEHAAGGRSGHRPHPSLWPPSSRQEAVPPAPPPWDCPQHTRRYRRSPHSPSGCSLAPGVSAAAQGSGAPPQPPAGGSASCTSALGLPTTRKALLPLAS